ncbi:signal recognition particle receptor subunit alpha [Candidatus Lokiarchaeum ossiferum]
MVLENFGKTLDGLIRKVRHLPEIDKNAIDAILLELQRSLLMADVKVEICFQVTENIRKRAMDQEINKKIDRREFIIKILHDELINLLGGKDAPKRIKTGKQTIILLIGIQGSGKTTTVGKLANFYSKNGFKVGAICTDTDRPGAYEQMAQTMDSIGVKYYGNPKESSSIKLARKGIKLFSKPGKDKTDLIIIDTAGRHKNESGLMAEMQKLEKIIKPNETILVIDGTLGQQAYSQAKAFSESTHVGSIIITKLDGSAKGGGALSAAAATNAPIKFIGVGERVDDLDKFHPTSFVGTLMGIPDLQGLMKKMDEVGIEPDKDQEKRMRRGKMTLNDMYLQLKSIGKMGGLKKLLGFFGKANIPKELKDVAEDNLDRIEVIMNSMTPYERDNPAQIKRSRIDRIAKGSGTTYSDVKALLKQWSQLNKTMREFLKPKRPGKRDRMNSKGKRGIPDFSSFKDLT